MKKLFGILALFVLMASSVLATNLVLTPEVTTMDTTDSQDITACVTEGGDPLDVDLVVETYCLDVDNDGGCFTAADLDPTELGSTFTAVATDTPTGADGCGTIHLATSGAATGKYRYKVNGQNIGTSNVRASETGLVLIPEFTTIGAGLVLAGAGAYMYRKRSRK